MSDLMKRQTILVVKTGRHDSGVSDIWHTEAIFFFGRKYKMGSGLAGKFDRCGLSDAEVRVRFQHDNKNQDYAPEIIGSLENAQSRVLMTKVLKAAGELRERYQDITRDQLVAELGAVEVKRDTDMWTFRPVVVVPS